MVEVPAKMYAQTLAKNAKLVVRPLAQLSGKVRAQALESMTACLRENQDAIFEANQLDIDAISKELDPQIYRQMLDRVRVTEESIDRMVSSLEHILAQPDPIGEVPRSWCTADGMQISRVRVPLGVLAVVSDMDPQVTVESFGMCLKTANVCIFRGGTEWLHTNSRLCADLQNAAAEAGVPTGSLTLFDRSEPEGALEFVRLTKWVDAVIPRGKAGLLRGVMENARVPVIGYDGGVSHVYVDGDADIPMAQTLVVNSKIQKATASNAVDTVLIHQNVSRQVLPGLVRRCLEEFKVELRGCPKTVSMMGVMEMTGHLGIQDVTEKDWGQKYQSMTMGVKIVKDMDEALDHIATHSPGHTATIVTRSYDAAMRFATEVDASAVFVNASTRLHGGEQFGLGPELGMNTRPIHAKGPLTLHALTCEKYVVLGTGQLQHPHPVPEAYEDAMMLSPRF